MQATLVTNTLLPIALGLIMFGLGLSLTVADFARVVRFPKAILIGLFTQTVILVGVAFAIAKAFDLSPELSVGLMLLAAAPGGATANVYSHLARGDVALNITLTAVNSALALLTLPLIVNWSLAYFLGQDQYVPPPTRKIVEVAVIIVVPVLLGMLVRAWRPGFAAAAEKPLRVFAVLVLAALVVTTAVIEWDQLRGFFAAVGIACLLFNLVSMAAGYALPKLVRLPEKQAIAIAMEIGIHNGTLAIFIALNVLGSATMSVPAAVYSLLMFITAAVFALLVQRRASAE
jgi:bile acid:Na+ symporter, BASS family